MYEKTDSCQRGAVFISVPGLEQNSTGRKFLRLVLVSPTVKSRILPKSAEKGVQRAVNAAPDLKNILHISHGHCFTDKGEENSLCQIKCRFIRILQTTAKLEKQRITSRSASLQGSSSSRPTPAFSARPLLVPAPAAEWVT